MQKLILCLFFLFISVKLFAQKEQTWSIKVGNYYSNIIFHYLPLTNAISLYDSSFQFIGTGSFAVGNGHFSPLFRNSLMIYKEKKLKNWLIVSLGMGYRQRGYQTTKSLGFVYGINFPNGVNVTKDIETRLHYISSDFALRMHFYKKWYFLFASRLDMFLTGKTTEEHEYITKSINRLEISPTVALGKEIILCDYNFLLEFEVNRGLLNVSNLSPTVSAAPSPKLWNFTYGVNVGLRF